MGRDEIKGEVIGAVETADKNKDGEMLLEVFNCLNWPVDNCVSTKVDS